MGTSTDHPKTWHDLFKTFWWGVGRIGGDVILRIIIQIGGNPKGRFIHGLHKLIRGRRSTILVGMLVRLMI